MEKLAEIICMPNTPAGKHTLTQIKDFLIWAYDEEFKEEEFAVKESVYQPPRLSLYVPEDIKTHFLALALNYAIQKSITKDMWYFTEESVCFLDMDVSDVKQFISRESDEENS